MQDIINAALESNELGCTTPQNSCFYKVRLSRPSAPSVQQSASILNQLEDQYVSLRIKRLIYLGRSAIAIYIRNRTKKVREKLYMMQLKEEEQSKK